MKRETKIHKIGPHEHLGTVWWFELFDECSLERVALIEQDLVETMQEFEAHYSRFREDSWLSVCNREGGYQDAEPEFVEMAQFALDAYHASSGVFNIAVGEYLVRSGYDAAYSFTSRGEAVVPALDEVLSIEGKNIVLRDGAQIDFGGFGKGYLIDILAQQLEQKWGIAEFLINGGGDMYASSQGGEGVVIALQHPTKRETVIGSLPLYRQGFAASSPFVRAWKDQDGTEHTHLVGEGEKQAVFVTAPTAREADMWATALSIDQTLVPSEGVKYHIV